MKMKYSAIPVILLMIGSLLSSTACSSADFSHTVSLIQAELPAAQAAATIILNVTDPTLVPLVADYGARAKADLLALNDSISAYNANPSATKQQKIQAFVDKIVQDANAQLLQLNGLKTDAANRAAQLIGAFAAVFAIIDGFIIAGQTKTQAKVHAAAHVAKLEQVLPLLDKNVLAQAAARNHVTVAQVTSYEQALGF